MLPTEVTTAELARLLGVSPPIPPGLPNQTVVLTQELRDCLTELADSEKDVAS